MNYYLKVLRTFSFNGRARRAEYWWFVVFNAIAQIALRFVSMALGLVLNVDDAGNFILNNNLTNDSTAVLEAIYSLLVFIQSLALGVRRFHDRGLSGWWMVGGAVAMVLAAGGMIVAPQMQAIAVGVIAVLVIALFAILVVSGAPGPNKYGADPKGGPEDVAETFA